MGITPRQVERLFIIIYSLIIHLEISIQNISLVLSCEPQPNCKLKAMDNCLNTLCPMYAILIPHSHNKHLFTPGGNNTFPSPMFLSLKLDIRRHEPTIKHNT